MSEDSSRGPIAIRRERISSGSLVPAFIPDAIALGESLDSHIPRTAIDEGVYEWRWALDDPVIYSFYQKDLGGMSGISLTADDHEHVQVLVP